MKNLFFICLLYLCFQLSAYAQEDGGLIILEEEEESERENFFSRYVSGEIIASYAGLAGDDERYNAGGRLRYNQSWDNGLSLAASVYAYTSRVQLAYEQEDRDTREQRDIDIETDNNEVELREAYIRYNNSFVDIYAGRRVLALGQFDAFSPVDFVLPVDLSDSQVEFTKLANKYPQTTLSVHLSPSPQLEFQFHYFPRLERDPVSRDLLELDEPYLDANDELMTARFENPDDEEQFIGRVVYNGNRLTAALTYYKGYGLYPSSRPRLILDTNGDPVLDRTRPEPSYPETEAYGFEIAVPVNNFVLKYEALLTEQYTEFSTSCLPSVSNSACMAYHSMLNENFNGRAYSTADVLLHAAGFDYSTDDWTLNIALFNLVNMSSGEVEEAIDRSEAISGNEDALPEGIFPGVNIARHYGVDKKHTTGFGGGLLGNIAGAVLYQSLKVNEDLRLGLSFEVLSYQSDIQSEDQAEDDANRAEGGGDRFDVDKTDIFSPAIRFSLLYSF